MEAEVIHKTPAHTQESLTDVYLPQQSGRYSSHYKEYPQCVLPVSPLRWRSPGTGTETARQLGRPSPCVAGADSDFILPSEW